MQVLFDHILIFLLGIVLSSAGVLVAFSYKRPRVGIDNRIYYDPIKMQYRYCIKVTNKSKRYCLYDLSFHGLMVYPAEHNIKNDAMINIWCLPKEYLKPDESQFYYLFVNEEAAAALKEKLIKNRKPDARDAFDFRKVFQLANQAQLQIILRCKHGQSGYTRIFCKNFYKQDFYNTAKLEA
ncbi:MAG: hypothetical protein LBS18_07625 [Clostridiales bacterium]|jgi:hypothetical protein|nr:hypothetical protein [Clostridiales bacterium]